MKEITLPKKPTAPPKQAHAALVDEVEMLDPAAAFALGRWGALSNLTRPGRPPRR